MEWLWQPYNQSQQRWICAIAVVFFWIWPVAEPGWSWLVSFWVFALLLQNCLLKHFPEERSFLSKAGPAAMKMPVSAPASPRLLLSLWLCILRLHRSLGRMHKGEHSNYTVPFGCYLKFKVLIYFSVQFCSVTQGCPTLCDPMDCSTPGHPVHHQLLEFTQTQVHRVGDAIQPSHPLSSPSPPVYNLSQYQGLLQWVRYLHQVAKVLGVSASTSVLPMNTQDWSSLGWTGWISLQSKELSKVYSILSLFLCTVLESDLVSFFYKWLTSFPSTTC